MIILGIETSCDETALAIVKDGVQVIASVVASQIPVHAPFGGVIPEIAAREHLSKLPVLWQQLLNSCPEELAKIDAIAVSQGPGLVGALLVGGAFAKGLALSLGKPLIPVNHVHAHVYGALLGLKDFSEKKQLEALFPALALVVSGGHTHLYLMRDFADFTLKCFSRDDACGEAFDKVAKLMDLPYPGGPYIEREALKGDVHKFPMPKVAERQEDVFFSYSGLKTFAANTWRNLGVGGENRAQNLSDLCASFQDAAFEQLLRKISHVQKKDSPPGTKNLIVAGGVAANKRLRELTIQHLDINCHFPDLAYCSDNAAMIASAAYFNFASIENIDKANFENRCDWDVYAQYPYEQKGNMHKFP